MTTRVADILERVRDSLSDEDKLRWSDNRLLRLIDEAQKKIAKKARLLRTNTPIKIIGDQNEYELPSDAYLLSRIVNADGRELPMYSHDQMDERGQITYSSYSSNQNFANQDLIVGSDWETVTGNEIEAIIYDKQEPRKFKVYPIPLQTDGGETFISDVFGVTASIEDDVMSPATGIVVDVSGSATGTVTFNSVFGVLVGMESIETTLKAYYTTIPAEIDSIDLAPSILEIEDVYDVAIKHYVVGMSLRDDQDTQNRQVGNEEISFYREELGEAKEDSSRNFKSKQAARTSYSGIE